MLVKDAPKEVQHAHLLVNGALVAFGAIENRYPGRLRVPRLQRRVLGALPFVPLPSGGMSLWAAREMRRHDWRMIIEAGHSISTYHASRWIGEIDVPTAVICTTEDRGVSPSLQVATAEAIPRARLYPVADGHLACASPRFTRPLLAACRDVADRAR